MRGMGWMGIMLFAAIGETRLQHAFARAALFEEFFLQAQELPVYKVVRLMNRGRWLCSRYVSGGRVSTNSR
jgi:hypothetical protein